MPRRRPCTSRRRNPDATCAAFRIRYTQAHAGRRSSLIGPPLCCRAQGSRRAHEPSRNDVGQPPDDDLASREQSPHQIDERTTIAISRAASGIVRLAHRHQSPPRRRWRHRGLIIITMAGDHQTAAAAARWADLRARRLGLCAGGSRNQCCDAQGQKGDDRDPRKCRTQRRDTSSHGTPQSDRIRDVGRSKRPTRKRTLVPPLRGRESLGSRPPCGQARRDLEGVIRLGMDRLTAAFFASGCPTAASSTTTPRRDACPTRAETSGIP